MAEPAEHVFIPWYTLGMIMGMIAKWGLEPRIAYLRERARLTEQNKTEHALI